MNAIPEHVVDRMIQHIKAESTDLAPDDLLVSAADFTSRDRLCDELDLMAHMPLVVAHASEVEAIDSFLTCQVLGVELILSRQRDGSIGAFRNKCRHRGGKVEFEESGRKNVFFCKYHGWSYNRDGSLRGIPYPYGFEKIDRNCMGLERVTCEERHGLIWVTLKGEPVPVRNRLGEGDEKFAAYNLDKGLVHITKRVSVEANWKLVMDGVVDILHTQFLHPDGVGKLFQTGLGVWSEYGRSGQVHTARRRLAERLQAGEQIDAAWRYFSGSFVTYPNTMVVSAPSHFDLWTIWPHLSDPGKSEVQFRLVANADALDDRMKERLEKSWEILEEAAVHQDFPMEETIQRNAASSPETKFLYGRSEVASQHLHRRLTEDIAIMKAGKLL